MTGAGSRWAAVRLVTRRELVERSRDRGFLLSTAVMLLVVVGFVVVPAVLERPATYRVALVGGDAERLAPALLAGAATAKIHLELAHPDSVDQARQQLGRETIDAGLVGDRELVVLDELPGSLGSVLQQAVSSERTRAELQELGLTRGQVDAALTPSLPSVTTLHPHDPDAATRTAIVRVGVLLLFGQVMSYAFMVATGVVEEKASRVVEVVLSTISARQLLAGKTLGIGLLGLAQLLLIGGAALAAAVAVDAVHLTVVAMGPVLLVLGAFLLGYAFYACLFAAAASTVSRQEELGNVTAPLQLVLFGTFFIAVGAASDSRSVVAEVASYLPPTTPLVMPVRLAAGDAGLLASAAALLLTLAATVALIPIAARLYAGAVLRNGARVRLGDAWRSQPAVTPRGRSLG
jgi:ABC-2 type transport system permease protein